MKNFLNDDKNIYDISKFEKSPAELAYKYLTGILKEFKIKNLKIETEHVENGIIFNIFSDESGLIIGKRGTTLDALRYLVNLAVNQNQENYFRVKIDVANYRKKREKILTELGTRIALRAIRTKHAYELEPMNAYDRRMIHSAVQAFHGVMSVSKGEGIKRHIIISPTRVIKKNKFRARKKFVNKYVNFKKFNKVAE